MNDPSGLRAAGLQGARAGLVSRFVANVIDMGVIAVLVSAAYLATAALWFILDPHNFRFPKPHLLLTTGLATSAAVAYLALGWWISGRTPGKQVVGLRVVDRRGTGVGLGKSIARAGACALFPLGLVWTAFSMRNASAQDLLLNTAVIYDWEKHFAHRASPVASSPEARDQGRPRVVGMSN